MSRASRDRADRTAPTGPPTSPGFWVAIASFVALVVATLFVPARPAPLMRGLGVLLLLMAIVFVGLPFIQLRRYGGAPSAAPFTHTTAVARRGLYAIVRHPQYLGYDLLAWGLALLALYWGTIIPALAVTLGLARQARAEEDYLLERLRDDYRAYRRMVPRFGVLTGTVRYLQRRRPPSPVDG